MAETVAETPRTAIRAPILFRPSPSQRLQMPLFEQNQVPRYLFRIHTPSTAGNTTISCVVPSASAWGIANKKTQDIFSLDPRDAATYLNEHLWWTVHHESNCNLISWISSLLFALHYGLHRNGGSRVKSKLGEILLFVLDTTEFPRGIFISEMEIIGAFVEYADTTQKKSLAGLFNHARKGPNGHHFGEYLSQGDLDISGRCSQTTMQRIIGLGLFDLKPELGVESNWSSLAKSVVRLRMYPNLLAGGLPPATTHAEVRKAIVIAEACFGDHWAVPVAAMLLALKHRRENEAIIVQGFAAMFSEEEIEGLSLKGLKINADKLPEVEQFRKVINSIHHHFVGGDQLASPFANLRYS